MQRLRHVRWETPASSCSALSLVCLSASDELVVDVRDQPKADDPGDDAAAIEAPSPRLVRFTFGKVPMHRSTRDEYHTGVQRAAAELGATQIIKLSPWLKELREREPLLDAFDPDCEHYVIHTEDHVIEVLASAAPRISVEDSAPPASH